MTLDLSKTATRLLKKLAISSTSGDIVIRRTTLTQDVTLGTVVEGASVDTSVTGAPLDFEKAVKSGLALREGEQGFVVDNAYKPEVGDSVLFAGGVFKILRVITKCSGAIPQVYLIRSEGVAP